MDDSTLDPPPEELGELLESFRWTERLARQLVRDSALAADLHQDTWTRALERFGSAVPGRDWLAGTLRSMAYRARRSSRRRRLHEGRGAQANEATATDEVIERSEAQARVAAATARLPKSMRVVLLLRFQEGLSLSLVAEELGCSKSTAGERVQRSLAALRKELGEEPGGWHACCVLALPFGVGIQALPELSLNGLPSTAGLPAASSPTVPLTIAGIAVKKLALATAAALLLVAAWTITPSSPPVEPTLTDTKPEAELASPVPKSSTEDAEVVLVEAPRARAMAAAAPKLAPARTRDPETEFVFRAAVVDEDGNPIPNPRMWTKWRTPLHEATGSPEGIVELVLNADNVALLNESGFYVMVGAGPYLTLWEKYVRRDGTGSIALPRLGKSEDLGTITLSPAGAVEGHAYTTSGQPITNAVIDVYRHDPDDPASRSAYRGVEPDVVTDSEGHFLVGHLLSGASALSVRHPDFLVDAPLSIVEISVGQTFGPVSLRAVPAPIVTGLVVGPKGEPLADVYLNGTGNWSVTDTTQSDQNGRFRLGLRKGGPSPVEAHHPGWRQVEPRSDIPQSAGEIRVVMEPILPRAAFSVLALDAESGRPIQRAGVSVVPAGTPRSGALPKFVTQPAHGIPVDFVPGEDSLFVGAKGYAAAVFPTDEVGAEPPHLTVRLVPNDGVRGRLLRNGKPVVGARMLLHSVSLQRASPAEYLEGSVTVRAEPEEVDVFALTGRRSYSPVSVLGLDGAPPPYRLLPGGSKHGTFTDEEGRFHFHGVESACVALRFNPQGAKPMTLGTYQLENGAHEIGDIELDETATLTGRFTSSWPWDLSAYRATMRDPDVQLRIDPSGAFAFEGLKPGPCYFTLDYVGDDEALSFESAPLFHVDLGPGEARDVTVDLTPYAPSSLDLEVTLGGKNPLDNCLIRATPVDAPERVFRLWCDVEGQRITCTTRALGLCHLTFSQASSKGGFTVFTLPGGPIDLSPGETARRSAWIPAGWVELQLPPDHPARAYEQIDLVLEGNAEPIRVDGLGPIEEKDKNASATLRSVAIPAGSYRARLQPGKWTHKDVANETISLFDVTIVSGEVVSITP